VGRPEGKRPLRRPMPEWEDNIKIYLEKVSLLPRLEKPTLSSCFETAEFSPLLHKLSL
jgi:hypothetical protein